MQSIAQQQRAAGLQSPLQRSISRRFPLFPANAAGKGFGGNSGAKIKHSEESERLVEGQQGVQVARRLKSKGKKMARTPLPPVAAPPRPPSAPGTAAGPSGESLVESMEFDARLAALKAEAEQKKAALAAAKETAGSSSSSDLPAYDSPPPLAQTLLGGRDKDNQRSLAEYENGSFGPSQVSGLWEWTHVSAASPAHADWWLPHPLLADGLPTH